MELNASLLATPDGDRTVVFGRYSGDHDLQDQVMDLLIREAPHEEAISLVTEFGYWRHSRIDYTVFFLDDDGKAQSRGSERLTCLGGLDDPMSPWSTIARTGEELLSPVEEVDRGYGERARLAGFTHVWGIPVADPLHSSNAVVAYARNDGDAAAEVHGYALDVMCKVLRLILQWRHQVESLRRAAQRDPLTGLANRTGFWAVLGGLEAAGHKEKLGLLYVDLDGFKEVNDRRGHAVGDLVLAEAAKRLDGAVRPGDLVARLGGDEFAIVARDVHHADDALAIAERIVDNLGAPYAIGDAVLRIGASVGVAVAAAGEFDADQLLESADAALYRAKHDGRGRWVLADGPA